LQESWSIPLTEFNSKGRFLALPADIILEWRAITVANTLAYYDAATVMAVKSFRAHASFSS
jgi:hypothetical protein